VRGEESKESEEREKSVRERRERKPVQQTETQILEMPRKRKIFHTNATQNWTPNRSLWSKRQATHS
jgi:hypothetical protein